MAFLPMGEGELDMTALEYQPVSGWLKHIEEKHGKTIAERCLATVRHLGFNEDSMVSELPKDRLEIIDAALQSEGL